MLPLNLGEIQLLVGQFLGKFHSSGNQGVKELQLSIPRESRKIKSIPRGISGNEICNGVPFISATWTLRKFFYSRNNCKNSEENYNCCLISDKH